MSTLQDHAGAGDAPTQPELPPGPRRAGGTGARRGARHSSEQAGRRRRVKFIRRGVAIVLVALLVPTVWSYYRAMTSPGTDPVSTRSVEWLKDHGMSGVVKSVEDWWYTHNAPPVGGKLKHGLPHAQALGGSAHAKTKKGVPTPVVPAHLAPPTAMQPLVAAPLAGEGVWTPTGRTVEGLPAVYSTYFRPDQFHTSLVASAMWMDTTLLNAVLVPGLQEPGGPNPWGGQIPLPQRAALVAGFNSAFKVADSHGGYYGFGQMVHPLVPGAASFVIDTSGKPNVGVWGRDFAMGPTIGTVRQNLSLLVDNGQVPPGVGSDNSVWGGTVGGNVFVWRSGVGVDAHGALIYVAGPGLSVLSLAILLQRAGAVRAMELDINSEWVSAYTFQQTDPVNPYAVDGVKLLPAMQRTNDRYLVPGERDFFALFAAH
jgi:hypothetical protein